MLIKYVIVLFFSFLCNYEQIIDTVLIHEEDSTQTVG